MDSTFRAFRIANEAGRIHGTVVDATLDELTPGEVVIRAAYSSVNYKDALAATGTGKILKRFPLIGGIDVAGAIEFTTDARFRVGDDVLVTGYDLGVANDGGYAGLVRVPGDWVVPLPPGLSLFESMALGTAGFTAALAITRLEQYGVTPSSGGPVAVTGATGGVGSIAVAALSRLGFEVHAITGKHDAEAYLRALGAAQILSRDAVSRDPRPLGKATWRAAVDVVGGDTLAALVRTTNYWGAVASTGLTGGIEVHLTVMPFILRGVGLLGIDSVMCPMNVRREVWRRLATDMKPDLASIATVIPLDDLPDAFGTLLAGRARGRYVVRLN